MSTVFLCKEMLKMQIWYKKSWVSLADVFGDKDPRRLLIDDEIKIRNLIFVNFYILSAFVVASNLVK